MAVGGRVREGRCGNLSAPQVFPQLAQKGAAMATAGIRQSSDLTAAVSASRARDLRSPRGGDAARTGSPDLPQ